MNGEPTQDTRSPEHWKRMAGSIIDTVHLTAEDYVNEKLVEQLQRYFGNKTPYKHEPYVTLNQREQCARSECPCGWVVQFAPYSPHSLKMAEDACESHIKQPRKPTDPVISHENIDAFIAEDRIFNGK